VIIMSISLHDAWTFARVLSGQPVNGEQDRMSEPWRPLAEQLAAMPLEGRKLHMDGVLAGRSDANAIISAMAQVDPLGPAPPTVVPTRSYATLEDIAKIVAAQPWLWRGWIASGVLNAVASDPGVGKTRFALDLARRLWFGLLWPDTQPNELPAGTRTLWVQGDRNFAEMLQCARDFGLPDDAVVLGSSPDDPTGSLDLDDPATLADLETRIVDSAVALVVIDTVGMVTSRNLSRPEEARDFFAPIIELAGRTGVPFLGLTHLSMNKEALGRRIVEKARVVIKMTQPDPEGQRDRRRLWVDKTAITKPVPLGVTMGDKGNDFDFDPPKEPASTPRKPGPPPARLEECKTWLTDRLATPARVKDLRTDSEAAGFSTDTLYKSHDALKIEEYTFERRKWWKLPAVEDVGVSNSGNSDNSDTNV
jgi:hypothetical protein